MDGIDIAALARPRRAIHIDTHQHPPPMGHGLVRGDMDLMVMARMSACVPSADRVCGVRQWLEVRSIADAIAEGDVVIVMLPVEAPPRIYVVVSVRVAGRRHSAARGERRGEGRRYHRCIDREHGQDDPAGGR